jgi:hypothetical protein
MLTTLIMVTTLIRVTTLIAVEKINENYSVFKVQAIHCFIIEDLDKPTSKRSKFVNKS